MCTNRIWPLNLKIARVCTRKERRRKRRLELAIGFGIRLDPGCWNENNRFFFLSTLFNLPTSHLPRLWCPEMKLNAKCEPKEKRIETNKTGTDRVHKTNKSCTDSCNTAVLHLKKRHLRTPASATASRWTSFDKKRSKGERKKQRIEAFSLRLLTGWKSILQIRFEHTLFLESHIFSVYSYVQFSRDTHTTRLYAFTLSLLHWTRQVHLFCIAFSTVGPISPIHFLASPSPYEIN